MTAGDVPLLALALAAAATSQMRLEQDAEARLRVAFTGTVAATDKADRAYRAAVESTLPHEAAHTMLSTMAAFRETAHRTRESALRELEQIWRRYNREYGWFDPLDAYPAPTHGLSHADATRAATIGDRARTHVDALRAQANETVLRHLTPEQIESLLKAKLKRRELFRAALSDALNATSLEPSQMQTALDHLTALAEGWY